MFMRKIAFEDNSTKSKSDPEFLNHTAAGVSWNPSASGYLKNTYNSPFNLHKSDPNTEYRVTDSSLTSDAYRNEELVWQKRKEKAQAEVDDADTRWYSWVPGVMWWKRHKVNSIQEDHDDWLRGKADEAAKRMADSKGMGFDQLLLNREQNPALSTPAFRAPDAGDWETRSEQYRALLSGVQDDIANQLHQHDYTGTFLDSKLTQQQRRQMKRDAEALVGADYRYYSPVFGGITSTDMTDMDNRGKYFQKEYMRRHHTNTPPDPQQLWDWMRDPKVKQYYNWN
jgi:hypothetical protein